MRRLKLLTGGRPRSLNDLNVFQDNIYDAAEAFFRNKGAFIIQGCTVTGNDISAGIIMVDGKIRPFAGASSVTFPCYLKAAAPVDAENQAYETGGSNPTQEHLLAEHAASSPGSGEFITMTASGGRTWYDAVASELVRMKGNQTIAGTKTFSSDIVVLGQTLTALLAGKANSSHTHDASHISAGTLADARIPNLAAAKITSGVFNTARIPTITISMLEDSGKIAIETGDLQNGWTISGSNSYYRKISGRVHVSMTVNGNSASSSVVFTLPVGYRPSKTQPGIWAKANYVLNASRATHCWVATTGAVFLENFDSGGANPEPGSTHVNIIFDI